MILYPGLDQLHATRPARFLLTLPLVEPQHTASKHRHGRGHEEGERAGSPWTVAGDPTERKQDGGVRDRFEGCLVLGVRRRKKETDDGRQR